MSLSAPIAVEGPGTVVLGQHCVIGKDVTVVFHAPGTVTLGDCCVLGNGVRIVCSGGDVTIGDWTSLHDRCLLLSSAGLRIGEHGWFGQQTVLDGTGGLTIGHGVRVGMYSQLWSHVAAGEQIEGCTLYAERPVVLEDHVWLVGSCIVGSGVTLGRRTVALIGSNITRSFPSNVVLAGAPAQIKDTLSFYRSVGRDEQWQMLSDWLNDFATGHGGQVLDQGSHLQISHTDMPGRVCFVATRQAGDALAAELPAATICVLEDKSYRKMLTPLERKVLKYLSGNKARFISARWTGEPNP